MPPRRVALIIETSRQFGREMLRGVMRHQAENVSWEVDFEPLGYQELLPSWFSRWRGDGILARVHDRRMLRAIQGKGIPFVDLRGSYALRSVPQLSIDNRAIVQMAIEHLRGLGLTRFGYVGVRRGQDPRLDDREDEFCRQVEHLRLPFHLFKSRRGLINNQLADERGEIANWLRGLPKPLGILAYNDYRGRQVIDACRRSEISVPDEAAIVGVDNDEFLCHLSRPTLTSIQLTTVEAGYEAARRLERMMSGRRTDGSVISLRPIKVAIRQSTDHLAFEDGAVRAAVRFLRDHACGRISVSDVLHAASVSRRSLEMKFLKLIGRTINEEITRIRLDRAKQYLRETRLTTEQIAAKVGVGGAAHFSSLFKKHVGETPRDFRRQLLA